MIVLVKEVGDEEESILEVETLYDDNIIRVENKYVVKGYIENGEEKIAVRHISGLLEFDENLTLKNMQKGDVLDCIALFKAIRIDEHSKE
jgi:hypothetical protein